MFCENGPQGVREVSYELLGAAARLAKDAGTRVIAVALGAGAPVEEMCARGADEVLLVEDAALDAPEEMRYTEEICALAREFSPDVFLLGGTMFGRSLAPRVAARLSTGLTRRLHTAGDRQGDGAFIADAPGVRRQPLCHHPLPGGAAADGHGAAKGVPHAGSGQNAPGARGAQKSRIEAPPWWSCSRCAAARRA